MSDNSIRLAVLDMAGTTVADDGLVMKAFDAAASAAGIPDSGPEHEAARQYVVDTMGQSKITVFRALVDSEDLAQQANRAFEQAYDALIDGGAAAPIDGAAAAIGRLREAGVKVALTTGFSKPTKDRLLKALGWGSIADLTLAPSEAGRGRPYPDLILTALLRLEIDDVRQVAVLGDTANDIVSGHRAGARVVAGTLTGAHDEGQLRVAEPTHLVPAVADFADLLIG